MLRLVGRGGVGLVLGGAVSTLAGCVPSSPTMASETQGRVAPTKDDAPQFDVELELEAVSTELEILPGAATRVLSYRGRVTAGDHNALQELPGSYLGPILRCRRGQRVRIRFINSLDKATIAHWHGLHMPEDMDGHPRLAVGPGETRTYEFDVIDRAGTYWYHPHPHGRTGPQVYAGLAGLLIISDDEEEVLGLPSGADGIPLVIQDRAFDDRNQLRYTGRGMMDRMVGFLGDRILVNGQPDPTLRLAAQPHRLRLLNGSNSRIYKLAWEDSTALTVIGTHGGLLERPVQREYVMLAPGERIDLWVDMAGRQVGSKVRLMSLPFEGDTQGGMMGRMGQGAARFLKDPASRFSPCRSIAPAR